MNQPTPQEQEQFIKKTVDEAKLLRSETFRGRTQRFVHAITSDYDTSVKFEDGKVCTNGDVVYLDPTCKQFQDLDLVSKIMGTRGQGGHEGFHKLYTDFNVVNDLKRKYSGDDKTLKVAKDYLNIVEDSAVELAGCHDFPGLIPYIRLLNEQGDKYLPTIEQLEASGNRLLAHQVACSYYSTKGKPMGTFSDPELQKMFEDSIPHLDAARYASTTKDRMKHSEQIMQIVKTLVEEAIENGNSGDFQNPKGDDIENPGGSGKGEKRKMPKNPEDFRDSKGKGDGEDGEGDGQEGEGEGEGKEGDGDGKGKGKGKQKSGRSEFGDSEEPGGTPQDKENTTTGETELPDTTGMEQQSDPQGTKMDSEELYKRLEEQLRQEIQKEIDEMAEDMEREKETSAQSSTREQRVKEHMKSKVEYGKAHKGIKVKEIETFDNQDRLKRNFNQMQRALTPITRALTRRLQNMIKYNQDEKRTGQVGGFLTQSQLWRKDGKIFTQKRDKNEEADLVICLLLDESGSMGGQREQAAREAAVMMAEVCEKLGIPLAVIGHTAPFGQPVVEIRKFISFEKGIKEQKHQVAEACAREDNRDGLPLRYCAEYLLQQPQKDKILMVVADGEPWHGDHGGRYGGSYGGSKAEVDCTLIVEDFQKRGVTSIGIAIGDGQDGIARIFKNFVSVPTLEKLPTKLVKLLEKRIFKDR